MRFEKNPGQAADRHGILAEGAVTDAVCGIRTGQVEDRGQVHAESEASEGPDHGARLLSDRPGCGSPASQREVRGDGAEDRPQAVHPAALLVQSNEGRDPQETVQGVIQGAHLRGAFDIAGEQDETPGPHPFQERP